MRFETEELSKMANALLAGRAVSSSAAIPLASSRCARLAPGRRPVGNEAHFCCKRGVEQARGIERGAVRFERGKRSLCSRDGPVRVDGVPPVWARQVEFKARRQVDIPFREGAFPAADYLQEPERVVKVTFPDSARITYMGDSVWRTRLKPIEFFAVSAHPVCDIGVFNKGKALQIHSNRVLLEFAGLPADFLRGGVKFSLRGQLEVDAKEGSRHRSGREVKFVGQVSLRLGVDLPSLFAVIPDTLVTMVGDGILDTFLGVMESRLVRGIIADYHAWCLIKQPADSNVGALRSRSL